MDTLVFALNAVGPILILITLGYLLKKFHFIDEHFLQLGNKFVFRVALPAMLYYTIYQIESFKAINWSIIVYAVLSILILFLIGMILALVFIPDNKQKGVILQGVFRANYAIIGIPLAEAIGGDQAVAVVGIVAAFVVPLMNILAVLALVIFVQDKEDLHPLRSIFKKIVKNPLIIAIVLGLVTLAIRSWIPVDAITNRPVFSIEYNLKFIYLAIQWLRQMASPLALVILGGTFEFFVIKNLAKQIFIGVFTRTFMAPFLMLGLAVILSNQTSYFHFSSIEYPALISLIASPTAVSSAIMAKEMHNDEKLAVQLVVWTTSLSIVSIFITIAIFRAFNLL